MEAWLLLAWLLLGLACSRASMLPRSSHPLSTPPLPRCVHLLTYIELTWKPSLPSLPPPPPRAVTFDESAVEEQPDCKIAVLDVDKEWGHRWGAGDCDLRDPLQWPFAAPRRGIDGADSLAPEAYQYSQEHWLAQVGGLLAGLLGWYCVRRWGCRQPPGRLGARGGTWVEGAAVWRCLQVRLQRLGPAPPCSASQPGRQAGRPEGSIPAASAYLPQAIRNSSRYSPDVATADFVFGAFRPLELLTASICVWRVAPLGAVTAPVCAWCVPWNC